MSNLEDLPDEIILKILKNLEIGELVFCSKVSKKFRTISQDKSLWKKVNICDEKIPFGLVKQIVQNGCNYLSLYHCDVLGANSGFNRASQLKYLDLSFFKGNLKRLEALLSSCYSLQKLSLANLTLNLEIIEIVCTQNGQTLQVLDLAFCKGLSYDSDSVECIVNNCRSLTELNLNFTELSEASVKYLTQHLTPNITKLNVGYLKWINSECVELLVNRCDKITTLDLQSTSINTLCVITDLKRTYTNMVELDVGGNSETEYFNDLFAGNMLKSMPNLKVYNCDSAYLQEDTLLEHRFPGLKINQGGLKIATPEQSFNPDLGFWDIEASKVSYLGPVKGLCEASDNSDMLSDYSTYCISDTSTDITKLTSLSHHFATRAHRPSLKSLDTAACKKMDSDLDEFIALKAKFHHFLPF